jgi:hypothetical protein
MEDKAKIKIPLSHKTEAKYHYHTKQRQNTTITQNRGKIPLSHKTETKYHYHTKQRQNTTITQNRGKIPISHCVCFV